MSDRLEADCSPRGLSTPPSPWTRHRISSGHPFAPPVTAPRVRVIISDLKLNGHGSGMHEPKKKVTASLRLGTIFREAGILEADCLRMPNNGLIAGPLSQNITGVRTDRDDRDSHRCAQNTRFGDSFPICRSFCLSSFGNVAPCGQSP